MYAVIKTGGKQYRVAPGDLLKVEYLEHEEGDAIELDQVLVVSSDAGLEVGTPFLNGACVAATVVRQGRLPKVRIFKMRRRKHHQKRQGHRQMFTEVRIDSIKMAS